MDKYKFNFLFLMDTKTPTPITSNLGELIDLVFVPSSYIRLAKNRINEGLWNSESMYTKYLRPYAVTGTMEIIRLANYYYIGKTLVDNLV